MGDGGRLKDETGEWRGEGGNCRVVVNDKITVVGTPGIGGQGDDQGALLPRGDGSCSTWQGGKRQMVSGRGGDRVYVEVGLPNVFDSEFPWDRGVERSASKVDRIGLRVGYIKSGGLVSEGNCRRSEGGETGDGSHGFTARVLRYHTKVILCS